MSTFRNFFPALYHAQKVYVFGGYDGENKTQFRSAEYYDLCTWQWLPIASMCTARSQSSACRITDDEILICGGYNRNQGTLDTIEKYTISKDTLEILPIKLPIPLCRFTVVRVAANQALVLGGLTRASK
jgi:N-acetylneuraminic acid mutarotase